LTTRAGRSTQWLTGAPFELVSDRRARSALRLVLVCVLVGLGGVLGLRLYADAGAASGHGLLLERRNAALTEEIAHLRADLEFERATRSALDAQMVELTARIAELEAQLRFVHAQGSPPPARARP
jgi:Tfp pilus assembly protein PilN